MRGRQSIVIPDLSEVACVTCVTELGRLESRKYIYLSPPEIPVTKLREALLRKATQLRTGMTSFLHL